MEIKKGIHYSTELEQAILGVCLLERDGFGRVYGVLETECFYHTGHQQVFAALKTMYQEGLMIDSYTVIDFLQRVKQIPELEGQTTSYFVIRLTNFVVSGAHLEYHSHIVKMMWMDREIINLTHGGKFEGNAPQQIKAIQEKLYSLQNKAIEHDWQDMSQLMVKLYQHQEEMKKTKGVGVSSGIKSLDVQNGGFQNGQLVVIGARPSMGKSALIGGMAIEQAKRGLEIGIVSLEMNDTEIAARLAAYDTESDYQVLYRGLYRDQEQAHQLYAKIGKSTSQLSIFVTEKTRVNIPEIRAKAEKLKAIHGLKCLYIDYLQLVTSVNSNRTRENEIAEMSRGCKIMAKEMNIPVVLLCQLNREVTKRKGSDRYPQLSDLRESGAIEQDADIVMFLHRDFMMGIDKDANGMSTEMQADLVIRKWRNGKSNFILPFDFDPPKMKFTEKKGFRQVSPETTDSYQDPNPF